jgi:DNA-binding NtrC family response regulator
MIASAVIRNSIPGRRHLCRTTASNHFPAAPSTAFCSWLCAVRRRRARRAAFSAQLEGSSDINMPRMDGYEVIRHLRNNSAHKSTPILVLTTESETDKKNLARVAGATGWMVKPFDPERLIATINKVAP